MVTHCCVTETIHFLTVYSNTTKINPNLTKVIEKQAIVGKAFHRKADSVFYWDCHIKALFHLGTRLMRTQVSATANAKLEEVDYVARSIYSNPTCFMHHKNPHKKLHAILRIYMCTYTTSERTENV